MDNKDRISIGISVKNIEILKSDSNDNKVMKLKINCSNENLDNSGEIVLQKALKEQKNNFLKNGDISYDHLHKIHDNPSFVIGYPNDVIFNEDKTTDVICSIYKEHNIGSGICDLIKNGNKKIGASIGGSYVAKNYNYVTEIIWDELAITSKPCNQLTRGNYKVLSKSLKLPNVLYTEKVTKNKKSEDFMKKSKINAWFDEVKNMQKSKEVETITTSELLQELAKKTIDIESKIDELSKSNKRNEDNTEAIFKGVIKYIDTNNLNKSVIHSDVIDNPEDLKEKDESKDTEDVLTPQAILKSFENFKNKDLNKNEGLDKEPEVKSKLKGDTESTNFNNLVKKAHNLLKHDFVVEQIKFENLCKLEDITKSNPMFKSDTQIKDYIELVKNIEEKFKDKLDTVEV